MFIRNENGDDDDREGDLEREEEIDRDDMFAVDSRQTVTPSKTRADETKTVVPDHEKFPLKYTKYTFDEPVLPAGVSEVDEEGKRMDKNEEGKTMLCADTEEEEERRRINERRRRSDEKNRGA